MSQMTRIARRLVATIDAVCVILLVLIIVGIRFGVFTVNEASALAVLYALIVSGVVYRDLRWAALVKALRDAVRLTAAVMVILAAASVFAWMLAFTHLPSALGAWISGHVQSPILFLLLINLILLFVGTFMEVNAAKVMLLPVLFPIAVALGIDPIHFGVVVTVNLCLGLLTPPVGIVLALASRIGGTSIEEGTRGVAVFFVVGLAVLLVLKFIPGLSTWLPDLVLGKEIR